MNRKNLSNLLSALKDNIYPEVLKQAPILETDFTPENLSWQLMLADEKFRFIGKTNVFGIYAHLTNIDFYDFIKLVKKPFSHSQIDLLRYILSVLPTQPSLLRNHIAFEILVPLKLTNDYYYVKQTITVLRTANGLYGLQFVNIPIKRYINEPYKIEVLFNYCKDEVFTKKVVSSLSTPDIFTRQELQNFRNIRFGRSAEQIAASENKTKAAVYKLNRKIMEKISLLFDIEFSNVSEAVHFFHECFPQILTNDLS